MNISHSNTKKMMVFSNNWILKERNKSSKYLYKVTLKYQKTLLSLMFIYKNLYSQINIKSKEKFYGRIYIR